MKPMTGHFVPKLGGGHVEPMVVRLLEELQEFGKSNLYQAMLMWVLAEIPTYVLRGGDERSGRVTENCSAVNGQAPAA